MRGEGEHQTAHIVLMLCSKLKNLATMPRRAQAQHKCEDNIMQSIFSSAARPQVRRKRWKKSWSRAGELKMLCITSSVGLI
jgi:hypothetical protein